MLSRQKLPVLDGTAELAAEGVPRGAYVLAGTDGAPDVVLVGTGSEVALCLAARDLLATGGIAARVVSFPSWDLFAAQPEDYRAAVLPDGVPRLAVEAATSFGWERYANDSISIDRFGASAPGPEVMAHLGFTPDHVAERARSLVRGGDAEGTRR